MNVTILYSVPTRRAKKSRFAATDEDTKESAEKVAQALSEKGASVTLVPIGEDTLDRINETRADCVMNLIEWTGLDLPLSLAALDRIEKLRIPFTGATRDNYNMTSNKLRMKAALDTAGLPTPRWQKFDRGDELVRSDFVYPVIVKLAWEHCSIGIDHDAVVHNPKSLIELVQARQAKFDQPVFAEEFIDGPELQVTVLHHEKGPRVLPPAEIRFKNTGTKAYLTYESRWDEKHPDFDLSDVRLARLPSAVSSSLYDLAKATFTKLALFDYARLDVRIRDGHISILEANSNPGLDDSDDYGMTVSYKAAGMTFADFIWHIIASCMRRRERTGS